MEKCDLTEALRSRKVLDEEVKNSEAGKKLYPAKEKPARGDFGNRSANKR